MNIAHDSYMTIKKQSELDSSLIKRSVLLNAIKKMDIILINLFQ